ncbi:hypothetical protein BW31_01408 [Pantoea agglomerans]|uniref:hypothetical protein n=1 Tax=Enterobacter agglomerans TaxID=549 RepID=UPI0004478BE8|nr:hypothetical protein [Pantoea agglomerans]EZI34365.1 hypothetical protein BW31_01408 [Pantoea agglomerans]
MTDLFKIVQLFRASNGPSFDGIMISGTVLFSDLMSKVLSDILCESFSSGRFDDLEIDGNSIDNASEIPPKWGLCNYSFIVNQSDANRFYLNSDDFVLESCLSKGFFPTDYYIVKDDFYSGETSKPKFIDTIEKTLKLITSLAKIAHYHDIKVDGSSSFYRLVFVLHSESKSTSAVIETSLTTEILKIENLNVELIESLVSLNPLSDAHYDEKISTFRNTLIEYITATNPSFSDLVRNWETVTRLYKNNLAVYMSAFSFHKTRQEIADAEIDFAEKISKTLLELSNKVLAIPVSLVGAIALLNLINKSEIALGALGLLLTSLIMHLVIISQQNQFYRIVHAKNIIFESMDKKIKDNKIYLKNNSDIINSISEAKENLSRNELFCIKVLRFLLLASWMPVSAGILIILFKYLS